LSACWSSSKWPTAIQILNQRLILSSWVEDLGDVDLVGVDLAEGDLAVVDLDVEDSEVLAVKVVDSAADVGLDLDLENRT
jgi:hypothetical protein